MKISYNWLQTYFEKKLPPANDLAELINAHSFEIESIENIDGDTVLDVKVMPDRAHYALSHKGIAREIKAISGQTMKKDESRTINETSKNNVAVEIKERDLCRRYVARRIDNISVAGSTAEIQSRLSGIGARAINNIVDATNYVMFDIGQPLHAFDADKVRGAIVVRKAKKGEKIDLLPESTVIDGKVIQKDRVLELGENDLVIADDLGALAIAGVKGGKRAEISDTTKNIILESANFDPVSIRRTSTRLNIRNDSSKRFENEIIPELAESAMNKVTNMIMESSPSSLVGPITDIFVKKTERWTVTVSSRFIAGKIGIPIKEGDIADILERIDCDTIGRDGEVLVTPPLDRLDLKIPEDFADEVARIKGYENLSSELPPDLKGATPIDKVFYWSEKIKNFLVGAGYSEVFLYSLVEKGAYEIEHPLASDKSALRESIVPKMQDVLKINALNADLLGIEAVKIFEIGKIFPKEGEKSVLTIGALQVKKKKGITSGNHIKEALVFLAETLGIRIDPDIIEKDQGAVIEIDLDQVVKSLSTASSVSSLDFKILPRDMKYVPFSLYPFIVRDIALFVPRATKPDEIKKTIIDSLSSSEADLISKGPELFDTFEKGDLTSYAFRLIFQSKERTLTDEEVNMSMDKIYDSLKKSGWVVR